MKQHCGAPVRVHGHQARLRCPYRARGRKKRVHDPTPPAPIAPRLSAASWRIFATPSRDPPWQILCRCTNLVDEWIFRKQVEADREGFELSIGESNGAR